MLSLLTTQDFCAWFRALGDADAEEVATALELLQQLLPERAPPGSRDLVLWYQSATGNPWADERFDEDFFEFSQRLQRFVQHLASEQVQSRLRETSTGPASAAIAAITKQARLQRLLSMHMRGGAREALHEVERQYRTILQSLGIAEPPDTKPCHALRELNLRRSKPHMRVLYGVDAANDRALLLMGEHLDRNAYGPSVRRALRLWHEYLSGATESVREHVR